MTDINVVMLVGRLVGNSKLAYAQNGNAVVTFSIAVNRSKKTSDGRWEDETSYFDCVYFGRPAEAINPYLEKGRQVTIEGYLRQNRWEKDGRTQSKVDINVDHLVLGASAGANSNRGFNSQNRTQGSVDGEKDYEAYRQPVQQNRSQSQYPENGPEDFSDDKIPF